MLGARGDGISPRTRIALDDLLRAARVPVDGEEDLRRAVVLHVVVERLPEPLLVVRGHERIEQDERVTLDERVRRDLLRPSVRPALLGRPVRVERGPAPEPRPNLLELHRATRRDS